MNTGKIITKMAEVDLPTAFKVHGNCINGEWYNLPFYYKEYQPGYYEVFTYDQLPPEIKKHLTNFQVIKTNHNKLKTNDRRTDKDRVRTLQRNSCNKNGFWGVVQRLQANYRYGKY
jgi:hypothetical protein